MKNSLLRGHRKAALLAASALLAGAAATMPILAQAAPINDGIVTVTTTPDPTTGLVSGQSVAFHVVANAGQNLNSAKGRTCAHNANITVLGEWLPSNGLCTPAATATVNADPAVTPNNLDISIVPAFGTTNWNTGTSNVSLTCDVNNPCDVVFDFEVGAAGTDMFTQPLTFAGVPATPVAPTAVAGNQSATVSWTPLAAGVPSGNATIDQYIVTPYLGATAQTPTIAAGTASSIVVNTPALTNFSAYTFTVKARNVAADGTTHFLSNESPASAAVTPAPAATGAPTGTSANNGANLSWSAPAGPAPSGYRIQPYQGATAIGAPIPTGSTATSFTVGGLTNGQAYSYTVTALYGANAGAESAKSAAITANGALVSQTIQADRPVGALIISEACSGVPAGTYPQGPGGCNVVLPAATLSADGTNYDTTGNINPVTVTDTRDVAQGWNVSGSVSPFVSGANSFNGKALGWTPGIVDQAPAQNVTAGAPVAADTLAVPSAGLGTAQVLATTPAGAGLGTAHLGAAIDLKIPTSAPSGTYVSTLTITAV